MSKRESDDMILTKASESKKSKVGSNDTHDAVCSTQELNKSCVSEAEQCQYDGVKEFSTEGMGCTVNKAGPDTSAPSIPGNKPHSPAQAKTMLLSNTEDDCKYFASYGDLDIHRTMIDDSVRTDAYRRAIITNYQLFFGKTVLDVGCGTGILSIFCCQAGARRVYAVEASEAAEYARAVAAENGYADRVHVLQCRVEEATLPEQVDVIVSEWMGHALLYESMLESVLVARDRWLRPGGVLFPARAELKVALCSAPEFALKGGVAEFWRNVHDRYKVKMSCLAEVEERCRWNDLPVRVCTLHPKYVYSRSASLCTMELDTISVQELRELRAPKLELKSYGRTELTGLVLWFEVQFWRGTVLSTSPYERETHWGQTVLPLEPVLLEQDSVVRCPMVMWPDPKHPRHWRFKVQLTIDGGDSKSVDWVIDHGSPYE